jgi:hypothetical protein
MNRLGLAPFLGAVLLLFCSVRADAQVTVTSEPPILRAGEPATLIVTSRCSCPMHDNVFTRDGFTIDIRRGDGCVSACVSDQVVRYDLGILPAGVYTVRNHSFARPTEFTIIGTFAVAEAPPIPTLSEWAMAALALMLCAAAAIHLHR